MSAPLFARVAGKLRVHAIERWSRLPVAFRTLLFLVAFGCLGFGLCRLGLALTPAPASVALFWPAAGLVFGMLLVTRRRLWPGLLIAAGLPIALFNALAGQPPVLVIAFAALNALEATLATLIVLHLCGGRPQLAKGIHVLALVFAGPLVANGSCTFLSAAVLSSVYGRPWLSSWGHLWAGSGLGMLVVGTLVLAWGEPQTLRAERLRRAPLEGITLLLVSLAVAYLVFLRPEQDARPYEVLVLPPLVWTASRYGLRGSTAVGFAFVVLALAATVAGIGVFAATAELRPNSFVGAQVFCFVVILTSLFLASAVEDQSRAAQALRTNEEKYRLLVENQTDLVVKVDAAGHLLFVSPSYCRTFGKTESELLGRHYLPPVHEDDRESTARAMGAVVHPPYSTYVEQRALTVSGWRWLAWVHTAILDAAGVVGAVVGVGRDITDRRQVEDHLRQAEKLEAIGRLAGGVAHDFNNQLTAIVASTEFLASSPLADEVLDTVDTIREAALRSAGLTRQLLAFSRKQPSRHCSIDLAQIVEGAVALLTRSIDKRIAVISRNEGGSTKTLGDPDRLHAAVLNLALNARDAMPEGGTLTLSTRSLRLDEEDGAAVGVAPGPYVEVCVADTGLGMSEETRSHLFEPFYTTKLPGKGSGLGLAEVYGTARAHRGAVSVTSAPGKGTTVSILLPATESASTDHPLAQGMRFKGIVGHLRVLVVDDEPNVLRSVGALLRSRGCEVVECSGGREALKRLASGGDPLGLAIVDMVMPEMTGREVVAELRASFPRLPVIISSGFRGANDLDILHSEPGIFLLDKPYTREQLDQVISSALSQAASVRRDPAPT